MKFLSYLQLVITILMNICVWVLVIKNISGAGILGIAVSIFFIALTTLMMLFAADEIKEFKNNERTLGGVK